MDGLNFKIDNFADSIEFPSFSHDSAALLNLTGHALYAAEMARAMPGDTIGDGFRLIDLCCGIGGRCLAFPKIFRHRHLKSLQLICLETQ